MQPGLRTVLAIIVGASPAAMARAQEPKFKPGDLVAVVSESAELKVGSEVVAKLAKGHQLKVTSAKGQWVSCSTEVDGKQKIGWISAGSLTPATGHPAKAATRGKLKDVFAGKWQQTDNPANTVEFTKFDEKSGRAIIITGDRFEGCFYDFVGDDGIKLTSSGSPEWKLALNEMRLTITYPGGAKATFKRVEK